MRRLILPLLLPLTLAACATDDAKPAPLPTTYGTPAAPDDQLDERREGIEAMLATWVRDGDWLVSPPLQVDTGIARVGALLELQGPDHAPVLQAQLLRAGEVLAPWQPLKTTFSEGNQQVAVAEFGAVGNSAQVRLLADEADRLRKLQWAATIPQLATPADGTGTKLGGLGKPFSALGIVSRESWKARATKCTSADSTKRYRIAIHHTETPGDNPAVRVRAIQAFHMDTRGWCDIGYHFLVANDGTIFEGRPYPLLGAHTAGNNSGNIGVSFIGCFHSKGCDAMPPTTPPAAMLESAAHLLGTLRQLEGIALSEATVKGHRDHKGASTDCPGDFLYAKIPLLRIIGSKTSLENPGEAQVPPDDKPPVDTPPDPAKPIDCPTLSCNQCAAAKSVCSWCGSRGACGPAGAACAWSGVIGLTACYSGLYPCAVGSCWNPTLPTPACKAASVDEDFSSGKYNAHRYWTTIPAGGPVMLQLQRTAGNWQPALVVLDAQGKLVAAGEVAKLYPGVQAVAATSGRTGDKAQVQLLAAKDTALFVLVTGWSVLDGSFLPKLPQDAQYTLTTVQTCDAPAQPPASGWSAVYAGLSQSGMEIPRQGIANATLQSVFGLSAEPYGATVTFNGMSFVKGKISEFGGPNDTGVTPTETGAVSGEVLRQLNNPLNPSDAALKANAAKYYYLAMRWNYQPAGKAFWQKARVLAVNPKTGAAVVLRVVDWGPNVNTKRVADLSPQARKELGLQTDDDGLFAFAVAGSAVGKLE